MAGLAGAERLLRHRVAVALTDGEGRTTVAASVAGEPPCTRLAWLDWPSAAIVARLACPPGRPGRSRPVVATDVRVAQAGVDDRVLAVRAAQGVPAVQVVLAAPDPPPASPTGPDGLVLMRLHPDVALIAVDALGPTGEPVGRLDASGVGTLRLADGRLAGRLGAGHGMAAGFGAGRWTDDPAEAQFEAGYAPRLPAWTPPGLARGAFHVEPDPAYPAAPPAIAVAWGVEPRRVLLRQAPGPIASPDPAEGRGERVAIGDATGRLTGGRRFATLVWESDGFAFGVQVIGIDDPPAVAMRVAGSL